MGDQTTFGGAKNHPLLWLDELLQHFETMVETNCWLLFADSNHSLLFLRFDFWVSQPQYYFGAFCQGMLGPNNFFCQLIWVFRIKPPKVSATLFAGARRVRRRDE